MTWPHKQDKGDYFAVIRYREPTGGRPRVITQYNFRAEMNAETNALDIVDPQLDLVKRETLDLPGH